MRLVFYISTVSLAVLHNFERICQLRSFLNASSFFSSSFGVCNGVIGDCSEPADENILMIPDVMALQMCDSAQEYSDTLDHIEVIQLLLCNK
jgi:hypothetical protein